MDEPPHKFVEVIKIWEHQLSLHPVAIILYNSYGTLKFQLGGKIEGDRDHFKMITVNSKIIEIHRDPTEGYQIVKGGHVFQKGKNILLVR